MKEREGGREGEEGETEYDHKAINGFLATSDTNAYYPNIWFTTFRINVQSDAKQIPIRTETSYESENANANK